MTGKAFIIFPGFPGAVGILRYTNQPMQLEHWCLADYVSELEIRKKWDAIEKEKTYELEQTQSDDDTISQEEEEVSNLFPIYL